MEVVHARSRKVLSFTVDDPPHADGPIDASKSLSMRLVSYIREKKIPYINVDSTVVGSVSVCLDPRNYPQVALWLDRNGVVVDPQ